MLCSKIQLAWRSQKNIYILSVRALSHMLIRCWRSVLTSSPSRRERGPDTSAWAVLCTEPSYVSTCKWFTTARTYAFSALHASCSHVHHQDIIRQLSFSYHASVQCAARLILTCSSSGHHSSLIIQLSFLSSVRCTPHPHMYWPEHLPVLAIAKKDCARHTHI